MMTGTQRPLEVAVGIPTKDNAATITQNLESLRAQTRVPDRLNIVNENSNDTREMIKSYGTEARAIEIINQPQDGVGVGAARAAIYTAFDGDILCCLDTE